MYILILCTTTLHYLGIKPAFKFFTNQLSAGNNITMKEWLEIPVVLGGILGEWE